MLKNNMETFIGCDTPPKDADIVIFGAPFDATTSFRPGARFGAKAVRSESFGLETYSPYLDADLLDSRISDCGDLELPFGNPSRAIDIIESRAAEILTMGKIPYMIGGEHLATFGAVKAAAAKYPDLNIVHFDAHADLRRDYLGEKLSHACVIRLCHDILGDGRIFQFGIRSGDREEFDFAKYHTCMEKFGFETLDGAIKKIGRSQVYLTIDLDVLDPSIFSGTGTPEAGGARFDELRSALSKVCDSLDVVAIDAVELAPQYDASGVSTAVAAKIVRETLIGISARISKQKK